MKSIAKYKSSAFVLSPLTLVYIRSLIMVLSKSVYIDYDFCLKKTALFLQINQGKTIACF